MEGVLGRALPVGKAIGESWELYDFPPGAIEGHDDWVSAAVAEGPLAGRTLHSLVAEFGAALCGDVALGAGGGFPILIKYLDAREQLSVQVHPDEAYALRHPGARVKHEAWYVVQCEAGAKVYKGLKEGVTREQFEQAIAESLAAGESDVALNAHRALSGSTGRGKRPARGAAKRSTGRGYEGVKELLKAMPAKAGQCLYVPGGTVHALGAGVLVAEVQTPSDTTFRVFDFGRIDPATGRARPLHVAEAMECIDFGGRAEVPQARSHVAGLFTTVTRLCTSPAFKIEKVRFTEGVEEAVPYDQPVVWMMLEGQAQVTVAGLREAVRFGKGDTVLLPARMDRPVIKTISDCVWLEITFPTGVEVG
jgi:mannose-6-phosphate isomerase